LQTDLGHVMAWPSLSVTKSAMVPPLLIGAETAMTIQKTTASKTVPVSGVGIK